MASMQSSSISPVKYPGSISSYNCWCERDCLIMPHTDIGHITVWIAGLPPI
jgi:hypothetical protein